MFSMLITPAGTRVMRGLCNYFDFGGVYAEESGMKGEVKVDTHRQGVRFRHQRIRPLARQSWIAPSHHRSKTRCRLDHYCVKFRTKSYILLARKIVEKCKLSDKIFEFHVRMHRHTCAIGLTCLAQKQQLAHLSRAKRERASQIGLKMQACVQV